MQQIVDLQNSPEFQNLNIAYLSIAFDSIEELSEMAAEFGTAIPLLSDEDGKVSASYGVLQWAVGTGEPGHTFVLVGKDGKIAWIQDYGAPENGSRMYIPVDELVPQIASHLD
jgi:peroxiredoxin